MKPSQNFRRAVWLFLTTVASVSSAFAQSGSSATQVASWGFYFCPCECLNSFSTNVPPNLTNVVSIAGRVLHSLALRADGTVTAWGWNCYGITNVPSGLSNVVQIATGWEFSLALKSDGSVVRWGNLQVPTGLSNIVKIAAGDYHALALKADGSLVVMGHPSTIASYGLSSFPSGLTNIASIACGAYNNIVIRTDGSLVVWGHLSSLGIPPDVTNVVAAGGIRGTLVALKADGTIRAWGGPSRYTQVPIEATNIIAIAAGVLGDGPVEGVYDGRFLALRSDGRVFSWGGPLAPVPANLPFVSLIAAAQSDLAVVDTNRPSTPPVILGSPRGQAVSVGANVSLLGGALGYGAIHYQWFFNGTNAISGATNSYLYLTDVQMNQSGSYSFRASNTAGTSYSQSAILTILPGLQIQMAPVIYLFGTVGARQRLDHVNAVGAPGAWMEVATITLTNNPHLYVDLSAIGQPKRFYRSVHLP